MAPTPGDVRATARDDMINTMVMILDQVQENGLLTVPDHHKLTAAAQIFDKLSHHVVLKVLAGMAMPQAPQAPEPTPSSQHSWPVSDLPKSV